ncbi:MAG: 4-(cytidine 5'-diphospho)-2-C-methyl-D-erythritol kinase [Bacteroidota bacterium]|nr:4-(cytidine 5'-diphospho)-2-C-methyl-D-erythritol kinase [Bacteroidota bacterium]
MIRFPNAKINLGLRVLDKRDDGFHNIETIFYPVTLSDALEIVPSEFAKHSFTYTGLAIPPSSKNLCEKAIELLSENYAVPPLKLHLHKHIPLEAGLGGGSSDAACCLLMLNDLFQFGINEQEMMQYAAKLGSDCPFFIPNKASFAAGRGDELSDIDLELPGYYIRIIKPAVSVSTAEAYRNLSGESKKVSLRDVVMDTDPACWKNALSNDFEKYVFHRFPEIGKIKEQLYQEGAFYASLSGSGTAVFGLFEKLPARETSNKSCFVWDGKLI